MNYEAISIKANILWHEYSTAVFICALAVTLLLVGAGSTLAQTTTITYQGRLTDGGAAANGTYEMQFKLFDSPTVGLGSQIGSTITNSTVAVNNGVFTVQLDFGSAGFSGADRFLEIGVRPNGSSDPLTVLAPRQQLTSAVYAIRAGSTTTADNANQLGGVAANQYVQSIDPRLADSRTPTAGSAAYIQNSPNQQAATFNISGDGSAAGTISATTINATTQYHIGGKRVLAADNTNLFAGYTAGPKNTSSFNAFFGAGAGSSNTGGGSNTFAGYGAGGSNTHGFDNVFIGALSGQSETTGERNTFLGMQSGSSTIDGSGNTFIGVVAGLDNVSGTENVALGYAAAFGSPALTNAIAIGTRAKVSQSNSLILGSIAGVNQATADTSVGIGTTAPNATLHLRSNNGNILLGNAGCNSGFTGIGFALTFNGCGNYSLLGNGTDTIINRPNGGSIQFRENNVTQMTIAPGGLTTVKGALVVLDTFSFSGDVSLCWNSSNFRISQCSSSLRFKDHVSPFTRGLDLLKQLRPISFNWKDGGQRDIGFGAEDVAVAEPLLVTHNQQGEIQGVKYDRITAVLVNAVKEQQKQIEQQQAEIREQQRTVATLKRLVCGRNRRAAVCR
jgi:hypothetical protein